MGLFLMLQEDAASGSTISNVLVGMFVSLFILGFLYPMSLLLFGLPPVPTTKTRRP